MRLIDADEVRRRLHEALDMQDLYLPYVFEELLDDAPTIDAEPVVHCKDCKYSKMMGDTWGDCHNPRFGDGWANYPPPSVNEDGYCAWGEKLEKEENETD